MGKVYVSRLKPDRPVSEADKKATLARVFRKCVTDPTTGCVLWQGFRNRKGYGSLSFQCKPWMAHRLVYVLTRGPLPPDVFVCHRCDRPNCCNPDHLFLGDHTANQRDMVAKKRHAKGKKTVCKRGHPLSGDNLWVHPTTGYRNCLICTRARHRIRAGWPEELAYTLPATPKGQRPVAGWGSRERLGSSGDASHG